MGCPTTSTVLPIGPGGTDGENGTFGGYSGKWVFSTSTAASPSSTQIRLNNATYGSVTNIYVSDTNADSVSYDSFLDELSNSGNFGYIRIFKEFDNTKFWLGKITNVIDNGTDHTITVTYISHNSSFAANDNLILTFSPNGTTTGLELQNESFGVNLTLVDSVDNKVIYFQPELFNTATTANTIITLTPGAGDSYFKLLIGDGNVIGTGYTWKIKDSLGTTYLTLTEGSVTPREYECVWDGSQYYVFENASTSVAPLTGVPIGEKKLLKAEYDFSVHGGVVGNITLLDKIPAGAIVDLDNIFIKGVTALTSGGAATVAINLNGYVTDLIDSPRAFNSQPYISTGAFYPTKAQRYSTVSVASGGTTSAQYHSSGNMTVTGLTTGAAFSAVNTVTLTNSLIAANTRIHATVVSYAGAGYPIILKVDPAAGSAVFTIANAHPTNALNNDVIIAWTTVTEEIKDKNIIYVPTAAAVRVTIAGANLTDGKFYVYIPYQLFGS